MSNAIKVLPVEQHFEDSTMAPMTVSKIIEAYSRVEAALSCVVETGPDTTSSERLEISLPTQPKCNRITIGLLSDILCSRVIDCSNSEFGLPLPRTLVHVYRQPRT